MSECKLPHHAHHDHTHGPGCGHTAIRHDGHVDYLHDGTCTIRMATTSTST